MYVCMCVHCVSLCMYVCIGMCVNACLHLCVFVFVCVYMCLFLCVYVYTNVYIEYGFKFQHDNKENSFYLLVYHGYYNYLMRNFQINSKNKISLRTT